MGALQWQGVRIGNADDFRQGPQVVAASVEADDDAVAVQDPPCSVRHAHAAVADIFIRVEVDDPDDVGAEIERQEVGYR